MERRVKLQRDADGQFVVIPSGYELPSDEVIIRKAGDRLIIEPKNDSSGPDYDQAIDS
jgi:virulence-associated protein VagC